MDCFASLAMTAKRPALASNCNILSPPSGWRCPNRVPISCQTITERNGAHGETATQARRVYAAGLYSHRRMALSGRLARRQLQFSAYQEADPEAGSRKVRRLL